MARTFLALCLAAFAPLLFAASALDTVPDPEKLFADRAQVHAAVLALEEQPLHENAELLRAMLVGHYKAVDYIICGDLLGSIAGKEPVEPVMWQVNIASGDWVEAHPDQAKDIDAYTLAGLEAGARTYRNLLKADPGRTDPALDALLKDYDAGALPAWNKAHPCRPDEKR